MLQNERNLKIKHFYTGTTTLSIVTPKDNSTFIIRYKFKYIFGFCIEEKQNGYFLNFNFF